MPKYAFVTLNPSRTYMWELHAARCSDLYRPQSKNGGTKSMVDWIEAPNVDAALDIGLDPETRELGWNESSVEVLPCASRADERTIRGAPIPKNVHHSVLWFRRMGLYRSDPREEYGDWWARDTMRFVRSERRRG